MDTQVAAQAGPVQREPSPLLVTVIAFATGALVANLYYAQPLVDQIGHDLGVSERLAGSITSITQIGYGLGLFLLVSLADVVENRRLVLTTLSLTVVALIVAALSPAAAPFLVACLVIGLCSTGAQVLIPFVSHMVPPERRGRIVGNVMAGLLGGIMLARPASLFLAQALGWRAVFLCSAALMVAVLALIVALMPRHQPAGRMHYGQIIVSMAHLWRDMPILRWRALLQLLIFAVFNMFWTAAPLMLSEKLGLTQGEIGLFALAGAGGALAAPLAGRLADRGLSTVTTFGAIVLIGLCYLATIPMASMHMVIVLAALAFLLDAGVQGNQVVTQRLLFTTATSENRGRVNAIYMTVVFFGGAAGSLLATVIYHLGGWTATAIAAAAAMTLALVLFALQRRLLPDA